MFLTVFKKTVSCYNIKAVGPVAQWIEQYRPKVTVEGSTPFRIAIFYLEGNKYEKNNANLDYFLFSYLMLSACGTKTYKVTIDSMNGSEAIVLKLEEKQARKCACKP